MASEAITQEEIQSLAKVVSHKTELLIHRCDSFLSEEEGRKNENKRFRECRKRERKALLAKFFGIFGVGNSG